MAETLRPGDLVVLGLHVGAPGFDTMSRPGSALLSGVAQKPKYLLRGYLYERDPPEYEQWISQGPPFTPNPSGEPIQNVTVLAAWE